MNQKSEQELPPNEKQITEISITLKNGLKIGTYSSQTIGRLCDEYLLDNKQMKIETGAESNSYKDTVMFIPKEEILIFGISNIVRPSGLLVSPNKLTKI